jgi:hypothetical protein
MPVHRKSLSLATIHDMQKVNSILSLTVILFSCGQTNSSKTDLKIDSVITTSIQKKPVKKDNVLEPLIIKYISKSKNELVVLSRDHEEWIFDRREKTDTANYLIYQIGHDITDEGNTNPRFVTDQWIYIDSLRSKLYEYDLANDSLIEWKN